MLTDTKIRSLKPTGKLYKVADRDGLYVAVTPSGAISFRYNYKINGRQETLTLGTYGIGGLTLAQAREKQLEARKMVQEGKSPAREKVRTKTRDEATGTFGEWAQKWLKGHKMADSTRDMRTSVYERDLQDRFGKLRLTEITGEDVRAMAVPSWLEVRLPRRCMRVRSCSWYFAMPSSAGRRWRILPMRLHLAPSRGLSQRIGRSRRRKLACSMNTWSGLGQRQASVRRQNCCC